MEPPLKKQNRSFSFNDLPFADLHVAHPSMRHPTELAKERSVKGEDYLVFQIERVYRFIRNIDCTHGFEWHSSNQSCFNRKSEKNTDNICHAVGWGVKSNSNEQYIHAWVQQHWERNRNKVVTNHS